MWKEVTGDLWTAGESLFDMTSFSVDGKLYGTTESSGKVFRFEGTGWKQVFDTGDAYVNGYSIVEFKGYLFTGFRYFPNTGFRIVRSPDGVNRSTVWMSSSFSQGRFVVCNGAVYSWDGTMLTEVFNPPFADDTQAFTPTPASRGVPRGHAEDGPEFGGRCPSSRLFLVELRGPSA